MSDDERRIFQEVGKAYDLPAFLRRAHEVEAAWEFVLARCRRERRRLLELPRMRLATLAAISDQWRSPLLAEICEVRDISSLIALEREWRPVLQRRLTSTSNPREIMAAIGRLISSFERFNDRWAGFVDSVSLNRVNRLRTDYNRYYVIEKECAVRSLRTAQHGFQPMQPVSLNDVRTLFPLLHVPQIQDRHGDSS